MDDAADVLKPILPDSFQDIIASCTNDTFVEDIKLLSSILENIPVTEDALNAIEGAVSAIAEVRAHFLRKYSDLCELT